MAVPFDPNKNKEDETGSADPSLSDSGGTIISGESSTVDDGSANTAAKKDNSSGSFTNLQNYLTANADKNFGSQVAGKVGGVVDEADQAQAGASNIFKSDVDSNAVKFDQGLTDRAIADPTATIGNQPDYDAFVKQRDASYGGPNNFAEDAAAYSPAQAKTATATQTADASKTEGGRFGLLDQFYSRPTYNKGEKSLDNLLVQNDPNSRQAFSDVQNKATATKNNFDTLTQQLGDYATQAKAGTDAAKLQTQNALFGEGGSGTNVTGGAIGGLNSAVQNKYQQAIADANAALATSRANLAGGAVDPTLLDQYGLRRGTNIYHNPNEQTDLSGYLNANLPTSAGQVASKEDQSRMDALSKLANMENTYLPDAAAAGTYDPTKAVNFDLNRFQGDQSGIQAKMNDAINNTQVDKYTSNLFGNFGGQNLSLPAAISDAQQSLDALTNAKAYKGTVAEHAAQIQAVKQRLAALQQQRTNIMQQYGGTGSDSLGGATGGAFVKPKS